MLITRNTSFLNLAGTKTFRLASKSLWKRNPWKGWGTNLQNLEKFLRSKYRADDGMLLVQVDQAGAEAKIVAYLCKDGQFRDLFKFGIKPHTYVALRSFEYIWRQKANPDLVTAAVSAPLSSLKTLNGWKELDALIRSSDNWPDRERYYHIGKMVCHAVNYGMKGPTFQLNVLEKSRGKIVISLQEANRLLDIYHALFPEIKAWHLLVESQVRNPPYTLYNLLGSPRVFTEHLTDFQMKDAYAFVPQSTVGEITHEAAYQMQEFIEQHNKQWDILTNTHDSYLIQCPVEEVNECVPKALEFMQQEFTAPDKTVFRMGASASVGLNWAPYDAIKNPDGLKEVA